MQRKTVRGFVAAGLGCASLMAAAVWYSVTYNEARLVEPMDFSTPIPSSFLKLFPEQEKNNQVGEKK